MKKNITVNLFIVYSFILGCAVLFTGCTTQSPKPKADSYVPNYSTPPFIINSHQHSRDTEEWEKEFIEVYTKYHAMACVFWPLERAEHGIAFAKAHPDLVIPYIQIPLDSPTVLEDIRKTYSMGYKGFGEIPSGSKL